MNKNNYICSECGTKYITSEDKAPPTPKWNDGHECTLVKECIDFWDKKDIDGVIEQILSLLEDAVVIPPENKDYIKNDILKTYINKIVKEKNER